jgi:hypothetical protein
MPDSWHLVKQLASGLSLELIEDGAISHFTSLSLLYDSQQCTLLPLWHVICY